MHFSFPGNTGKAGSLCLLLLGLHGAPAALGADADPLFADEDLLEVTLDGPFATIDRERDEDKDYEGGSLTYTDDGREMTLEAKYQVRGHFRLRRDICSHAQLWVDLDKDKVGGTLFANQNRIKLVVQCRPESRYARYLIKEYQAYRFFNLLSDVSFRVRLARVTYRDTDSDETRTNIGFFIEDRDRLAARVGMDTVEENAIDYHALDPIQANLTDMFMVMIANTDYSIISAESDECCHNAKLFQPHGRDTYFPAPHDFDASGYVDTAYAEPSARLNLRDVRQRLYRGFCVSAGVLDNTLAAFRDHKADILAIAGDTTFVNQRTANNSVEYLETFFDILDDPEKRQREFLDDCRGELTP